MDKIETPEEFSLKMLQMSINDVPQREIIKAITARDALLRADERRKAAGWISVKERLPEKPYGCWVMVECDDYHNDPCHEMLLHSVGYDGKTWNDAEGNEVHFEVTHWMPLPEPPAILAEPEEAQG